jgi:uncharacterized protein
MPEMFSGNCGSVEKQQSKTLNSQFSQQNSDMKARKIPPKKQPEQIAQNPLSDIEMTLDDWNDLERGIKLFNAGNFWHAHEAWEDVWKRHDEDERLFFQGIIQLAAAYHHIVNRLSYRGAVNNLDKSKAKLDVFGARYLGIEIQPLLNCIHQTKDLLEKIGQRKFEEFEFPAMPRIQFRKPPNHDLAVELGTILESEEFFEGVKLFNGGLYWEAHEIWEALGREEQGDAKNLMQALVQMATAYSFIKLSRPANAKYLFEKTVEKLKTYEENMPSINIGQLIRGMSEALIFLQENDSQRHTLPHELRPSITIVENANKLS